MPEVKPLLRLSGLDEARRAEIRDLRGWLTTVVGRICLDRLRSAAVQREKYVGPWLPEPIVTAYGAVSQRTLFELVIEGADNVAYRLALNTLVSGQQLVSLDAARVAGEIGDEDAVRALAAEIAAGRADRAFAQARELLERSV